MDRQRPRWVDRRISTEGKWVQGIDVIWLTYRHYIHNNKSQQRQGRQMDKLSDWWTGGRIVTDRIWSSHKMRQSIHWILSRLYQASCCSSRVSPLRLSLDDRNTHTASWPTLQTINTSLLSVSLVSQSLTCCWKTGASHMCLPSYVSFTPSTSLSGVRTSPDTPSKSLTLWGNAPTSNEHVKDKHRVGQTCSQRHRLLYWEILLGVRVSSWPVPS